MFLWQLVGHADAALHGATHVDKKMLELDAAQATPAGDPPERGRQRRKPLPGNCKIRFSEALQCCGLIDVRLVSDS